MRVLPLIGILTVLSAAGAQSWTNGDFRTTFVDCARISSTEIACTFDSAYIGMNDRTSAGYFNHTIKVVLAGGQEIQARTLTVGKSDASSYVSGTVYKNLPVRVIAKFPVQARVGSFARVVYNGTVLNNVGIRNSGVPSSAPAPTPAATTPRAPNADAAKLNFPSYAATLTDCVVGSDGTAVCTAILVPKK